MMNHETRLARVEGALAATTGGRACCAFQHTTLAQDSKEVKTPQALPEKRMDTSFETMHCDEAGKAGISRQSPKIFPTAVPT